MISRIELLSLSFNYFRLSEKNVKFYLKNTISINFHVLYKELPIAQDQNKRYIYHQSP